jgi:dGTPase
VNVREQIERREEEYLSPHAAKTAQSAGRVRPETEHEFRTAYQRDRDRILHCKAFRRLKRKTQVFVAPTGDHMRTRLTHTLEVTQIARTAARALSLNEDLTEAIAMGHDLGHTPFGHAGESVLNELCDGGFRHFEQSLRVVDVLESTRHGRGLNLTEEVRDGILHHSVGKRLLQGHGGRVAKTLEGDVVALSDAIAYVNHDTDDALRAGIMSEADLPQDAMTVLGKTSSERIDRMMFAMIEGSQHGQINMAGEVREATVALRTYLYREVYPHPRIDREIQKAKNVVRSLFAYYLEHPDGVGERADPADPPERRATDMIAGMTDQYALAAYAKFFLPVEWPTE